MVYCLGAKRIDMKKYTIFLWGLLLFISVSSCNKDETENAPVGKTTPPVDTVDSSVLPEGFPTVNSEYVFPQELRVRSLVGGESLDKYIPEDNPMTNAGVELGRYLFYDTKLSLNNNQSCGSCHKQEFAFSDTNTISFGTSGQPGRRQSMAIFNMLFQKHFFWDGRSISLEHQVLEPIQDPTEMDLSLQTMVERLKEEPMYPEMFKVAFGDSTITHDLVSKALSQFVRSIVSVNTKFDDKQAGLANFTTLEKKGEDLFNIHPDGSGQIFSRGADCMHCHVPPNFATVGDALDPFVNNGLNPEHVGDLGRAEVTGNPADEGRFKIVTLRNLVFTPPYMHNGSLRTLADVIDFYSDHKHLNSPNIDPDIATNANEPLITPQLGLTQEEKEAVLAFLNTLTDSTLITNPAYANPFKNK